MTPPKVDLWTSPPELRLQQFEQIRHYARQERLPWRRLESGVNEELRTVPAKKNGFGRNEKPFPLRAVSLLPRRQFQRALRDRFENELSEVSANALKRTSPIDSAAHTLSTGQLAGGGLLLLASVLAVFLAPVAYFVALNVFATAYFICAIGFRLLLTGVSIRGNAAHDMQAPPLEDADLPEVTILLPVYHEATSLPVLSASINELDYPREKLDIKLLVEADDEETLFEARRLGLDRQFELVAIPSSTPRTKPKACNHALYLARGELTVIYDAEDQPEPDQLRKAAAAMKRGGSKLACVQARLNYYNADENWLTRLFALEYALWFDSLLPALERLGAPIPLGGTSNIFRTETLLEVGGWDPYNVTEDADLGLRLARRGYRTEILDSTTFEEANCRTGNWIRQRSRWMKGYVQTWFVHMRRPRELLRVGGWCGFASTQLFVAGNVFSALINPLLWLVFFYWFFTRDAGVSVLFPGPILWLNLFALLIGNFFFIYLAIVAPLKRGWPALSPYALLAPAYWTLTSVAAYKALWQLATRPHFWEKTTHVLSSDAKAKRAEVLKNYGRSL
ncbi:MAG: glycosyltransferase family 2 protein [Parvularculaceae bacterium]